MPRRIGELLAEQTSRRLVGREAELDVLLRCLDDDGPPVTQVHGIGGCGKSALLAAFCARARDAGAAVVQLDCRGIEPTERGFLHELGQVVDSQESRPVVAAEILGGLADRVVLALDTYERFRLLDTWLRQVFIPALPDSARVVLSGREPPVTAWVAAPGWQGLFRSIALGPLKDEDALRFFEEEGIAREDALRINRFARGHPLALTLAAAAARERPDLELERGALQRTVEQLTHLYLEDVSDPLLRKALQAASSVRRTTVSLLEALLPGCDPEALYGQLRVLPFIDSERDGLHLHDVVQEAIGGALRAADPNSYREYRRAAWRELRRELRDAGAPEMWRFTADLLYLIENPVVREAFFPSSGSLTVVEPASPAQAEPIELIVRRHEGPEAADALLAWWEAAPDSFATARAPDGKIVGFYCMRMFDPGEIRTGALNRDPIARAWAADLDANPVSEGGVVLFIRRWLCGDEGEQPSGVQAACWLDCKRAYMELRPRLRRVYLTARDLGPYAAAAQTLGFRPVAEAAVALDGETYQTARLDFGPESVDGWLSTLVAAELGIEHEASAPTPARVPSGEGGRSEKRLAHYRILGALGAGGMGEVYLALDTKLERRVALKILPQHLASDPESLGRFEREARALAALNHPNIVTIYSVEEVDGIHFLTIELIDGSTLAELIPPTGLDLERFFDLAVPLADSLVAAHKQGVIHRDLKPGNVMVSKEGHVKVLDFGLAKLRQERPSTGETTRLPTEQLTMGGRVLGTVAYMSPEQVQGRPVDARSDIFSLGVVLYEMTTGGRPFRGETPAEVISAILRDTPPRVSEIRDDLPQHLGRILRRCLEKDPDRRYQTALDLRNELQDLRAEVVAGV